MSAVPSRLDDLRNLRVANLDAALANAFIACVTGAFLVGMIRLFGGGDLWIGLVTAIPSALGLLQIPGAVWGRRFPSYKKFVAPGGLIWRLVYIPIALLPFIPLSNEVRLALLLGLVCLGAAVVNVSNPIYNDWLAEMVPAESRGWFFSRRSMICSTVGAIAGLLGGFVLDGFRARNQEALGLTTVMLIGCSFALVSFYFYQQMQDRTREHLVRKGLRESLREFRFPFVDRHFRFMLLFLGMWVIGQSFAGNFFAAFALESLQMPFAILQLCGLCQAVGMLATARFWGFLGDKYGNKPILVVIGVGLFLTPLMWLFCMPGRPGVNAAILLPGHVFSGVVWAGVNTLTFNMLLATSSNENRATYLGAGMAIQATAGSISPFVGSLVMNELRHHLPPETSYKIVIGICMLLRLLATGFLTWVREPGSSPVASTLRHLRNVRPKGYRALKKLSTSPDESEREEAMANVAAANFGMAVEELIKTLHDPSPRLRRKAAQTLADLRDRSAVEPLIHQLQDHPDLVEVETISALGRLAGAEAVKPLAEYLRSPRPQLRRAAAHALGRTDSPDATKFLLPAASDPADPDLRRAALQALRELHAVECEPIVAKAILDERPSVRIAAAEAIVELNFTASAPALRQSLVDFPDEASSEVAYALGRIGRLSDLRQIAESAQKCVSMITRRRCLLGMAHLLDVERPLYRLILLEGMSRDNALLAEISPGLRRDRILREAMDLYSLSRESEAFALLCSHEMPPALRGLEDCYSPEIFLVAILAAAQQVAGKPKGV